MTTALVRQRLHNQHLAPAAHGRAAGIVAALGAVQAQEYAAAKWALALRMRDPATDAEIERAFDAGRILRTHVLRPTWHFVTPADIRWMLELTAPRVRGAMRYAFRVYDLDPALCIRATTIFERALRDARELTRADLRTALARAGVAMTGVRLALLTMYAELEGIICSGPRRKPPALREQRRRPVEGPALSERKGRRVEGQMTYALLADRAPRARTLDREEALAELTARYFTSHGPATVRDFVWWSGLAAVDARRGLDMARAKSQVIDGGTYWTLGRDWSRRTKRTAVHLLPIYDEYLVAYRDRAAVCPEGPSGAMSLQPALVVDGQVAGTWKASRQLDGVVVEISARRRLTGRERLALADTAAGYGRFLGVPVSISMTRSRK